MSSLLVPIGTTIAYDGDIIRYDPADSKIQLMGISTISGLQLLNVTDGRTETGALWTGKVETSKSCQYCGSTLQLDGMNQCVGCGGPE